jgi:hypothetical protein
MPTQQTTRSSSVVCEADYQNVTLSVVEFRAVLVDPPPERRVRNDDLIDRHVRLVQMHELDQRVSLSHLWQTTAIRNERNRYAGFNHSLQRNVCARNLFLVPPQHAIDVKANSKRHSTFGVESERQSFFSHHRHPILSLL